MHVCIVGAGRLGRVYGVRLAREANESVSFVVRDGAHDDDAMRIERVDAEAHVLDRPHRVRAVPGDADITLVCVRAEQIDEALLTLLDEGPHVPAVVLTPMLPHTYARVRDRLGARIVAAMPSVAAYGRDDAHGGVTRYWLPRAATTLFEEPRGPHDPALAELVGALDRARIPTRFQLGVHEESPATTIAVVPILAGIDAAGGIEPLLADDALLALTFHAADEASALAARVGSVATWASVLLKFAGPRAIKIGLPLARSRAPEALRYADRIAMHSRAQNVALVREAVALAEEKGTPHEALAELAIRLEPASPPGSARATAW
jgi:2-dehydropantoate 2-reductase